MRVGPEMAAQAPSDLRKRYLKRWSALKSVRSTWDAHIRDVEQFINPGMVRFNNASDRNRGGKIHGSIINSTATVALRTLAAGMMAGITSPSRAWFRLTTPDPRLGEMAKVRAWLDIVEDRMRMTLLRGNVYNSLPLVYTHLGAIGTGLQFLEADFKDVVRAYVCAPGSYAVASSARNDIDTVFREVPMTVSQMAGRFGRDCCSQGVQQQCDRNPDQVVNVLHVCEPRDTDGTIETAENKRWASNWFEQSPGQDHTQMLRTSGYDYQPFQATRWEITGTDDYGRGPGMIALGDAKALQQYEKRKATLIDKLTDPPMKGPSSLRNQSVSLVPGSMTYEDTVSGGARFEPAQVILPGSIEELDKTIAQHQARIEDVLFARLWLMIASRDQQMTATEVAALGEEKMLQLGPVLERLQDELLDPMLDFLFFELLKRGDLPPPPPELVDVELGVEHISLLAQAQKLIRTSQVDRLLGVVGNMAVLFPSVKDKVDADKVIDAYADMLGVKVDLVRSADEVAQIRADRDAAAQQQQQMAQAQQLAQGAQTLSQTDTSGDNALTRMLGGMGMGGAGQGAAIQ